MTEIACFAIKSLSAQTDTYLGYVSGGTERSFKTPKKLGDKAAGGSGFESQPVHPPFLFVKRRGRLSKEKHTAKLSQEKTRTSKRAQILPAHSHKSSHILRMPQRVEKQRCVHNRGVYAVAFLVPRVRHQFSIFLG